MAYGESIGDMFYNVRAVFTQAQDDIKSFEQKESSRLILLKVGLDLRQIESDAKKIDEMIGKSRTIKIDFDTSAAEEKMRSLDKMGGRFSGGGSSTTSRSLLEVAAPNIMGTSNGDVSLGPGRYLTSPVSTDAMMANTMYRGTSVTPGPGAPAATVNPDLMSWSKNPVMQAAYRGNPDVVGRQLADKLGASLDDVTVAMSGGPARPSITAANPMAASRGAKDFYSTGAGAADEEDLRRYRSSTSAAFAPLGGDEGRRNLFGHNDALIHSLGIEELALSGRSRATVRRQDIVGEPSAKDLQAASAYESFAEGDGDSVGAGGGGGYRNSRRPAWLRSAMGEVVQSPFFGPIVGSALALGALSKEGRKEYEIRAGEAGTTNVFARREFQIQRMEEHSVAAMPLLGGVFEGLWDYADQHGLAWTASPGRLREENAAAENSFNQRQLSGRMEIAQRQAIANADSATTLNRFNTREIDIHQEFSQSNDEFDLELDRLKTEGRDRSGTMWEQERRLSFVKKRSADLATNEIARNSYRDSLTTQASVLDAQLSGRGALSPLIQAQGDVAALQHQKFISAMSGIELPENFGQQLTNAQGAVSLAQQNLSISRGMGESQARAAEKRYSGDSLGAALEQWSAENERSELNGAAPDAQGAIIRKFYTGRMGTIRDFDRGTRDIRSSSTSTLLRDSGLDYEAQLNDLHSERRRTLENINPNTEADRYSAEKARFDIEEQSLAHREGIRRTLFGIDTGRIDTGSKVLGLQADHRYSSATVESITGDTASQIADLNARDMRPEERAQRIKSIQAHGVAQLGLLSSQIQDRFEQGIGEEVGYGISRGENRSRAEVQSFMDDMATENRISNVKERERMIYPLDKGASDPSAPIPASTSASGATQIDGWSDLIDVLNKIETNTAGGATAS